MPFQIFMHTYTTAIPDYVIGNIEWLNNINFPIRNFVSILERQKQGLAPTKLYCYWTLKIYEGIPFN